MKISSTDFADFYNNGWPKQFYIDEYEILDKYIKEAAGTDGLLMTAIDPAAAIDIKELDIPLIWEGSKETDPTDGEGINLAGAIKKFLQSRTHATLVFLVPKESVKDMIAYAATKHCKVLSEG